MKRVLLSLGFLLGLTALAGAQVNTVPQVGLTTSYLTRNTYSAAFIGLVPAASATDVICLAGSATKTIHLKRIHLSGSAGTLVSLPITLVRRVSVDTGGTAGSTTANPANNISAHNTANPTATAVPIAYTANPTIVDTAPTYLDSLELTLPVTSAGTSINPLEFNFMTNASLVQGVSLSGVAAQVCLNFNAVSVSSGVLNGTIMWTEE